MRVTKVNVGKEPQEKSYNEQVAEENKRRMKGISDILLPKSDGSGVLNSAGVEITTYITWRCYIVLCLN